MCGVLGIKGLTTLGQGKILLQMLTHRGQDASGLAWIAEGEKKIEQKKVDGYPDLLDLDEAHKVTNLIGSTRYPTFGTRTDSSNIDKYAQPFRSKTKFGILELVHNGNITNLNILTEKRYESDANFITDYLAELIDKYEGAIKEAVEEFMRKIDGSYSAVAMLGKEIFAFRDPKGIRPLVIGKNETVTIVASESVVLQNMGIMEFESVKPGELIVFTDKEWKRSQLVVSDHSHCMFEYVYFANPCSIIEEKLVYDTRIQLGRELALRIKQEFLDIPVREAIIKNRYLQRTFIMKSEKERSQAAKRKYLYISKFIKGKNILLVDDSVVRGLTSKKIVNDLRNLGANKVYLAITCPAVRFACYYGIDIPTDEELIASGNTLKDIERILNVDALYYQRIESLKNAIGFDDLCTACLSGSYPTSHAEEIRIKYLNGELTSRSHYE
ncbi:MAG: amidophosphoribosyltransferase [Candidatus Heimdallarchaeaceae archaeon]